MPINITNETFDSIVLKSDKPVLVDFWAEWCGPCRMLSPVIDEIEKESPEFTICKVNIDEQPELAKKYSVMTIPTLILFKDGEPVTASVGAAPKEKIMSMLNGLTSHQHQ